MLRLIALLNYLIIIVFTNGGNGTLLNMQFYKTWTGGMRLQFLQTHSHVTSTIGCAVVCKKNREMTYGCLGFRYLPLGNTCDLYTSGSSPVPSPGEEIYLFHGAGVFHSIRLNDKLYSVYLSDVNKTFFDARVHCNSLGGYLLEFDSLDEYQAVEMAANGLSYDYAFVGANDIEIEDTWVTDKDGSPMDTSKWLWNPEQPNKAYGDEDCACIRHSTNKIYDYPCGYIEPFFCEK